MAKNKSNIDITTEEKIKEAARIVFTRNGYVATKVRDIAAEADINLSLVNYYFRSKEKLFELIMAETIQKLFNKILPIFNDTETTLNQKIELLVNHYIEMLIANPDFPLFIVNEIMSGSSKLPLMTQNGQVFLNSHMAKQLLALKQEGRIAFHPLQLMINLIGMIVFPFLARPMVLRSGALNADDIQNLVEERKRLIPVWIKQMIKE